MLDLDGAAAGEALRVLEHEAARGDRPGVDADVALDDDLGGGLLAGATKATAGAARRARASLAILDLFLSAGVVGLETVRGDGVESDDDVYSARTAADFRKSAEIFVSRAATGSQQGAREGRRGATTSGARGRCAGPRIAAEYAPLLILCDFAAPGPRAPRKVARAGSKKAALLLWAR